MSLTRSNEPGEAPKSLQYRPVSSGTRFSLADCFLLYRYHLKVLSNWLLVLIGLGFATGGVILWLQAGKADAESAGNAAQLSRFVMEAGAGLVAGLLASSLVMGDPLLEILMTTPSGIAKVVAGRFFLSFGLLMLYAALYLGWSLLNGVSYAREQSPLYFLLIWLAPVATVSMLALLGSLLTRNAALGLVFGLMPLAGALFLEVYLLPVEPLHPFLISYTLAAYDAPDWWLNRLTLLGIGLALAGLNRWTLHHEERLLIGN